MGEKAKTCVRCGTTGEPYPSLKQLGYGTNGGEYCYGCWKEHVDSITCTGTVADFYASKYGIAGVSNMD